MKKSKTIRDLEHKIEDLIDEMGLEMDTKDSSSYIECIQNIEYSAKKLLECIKGIEHELKLDEDV